MEVTEAPAGHDGRPVRGWLRDHAILAPVLAIVIVIDLVVMVVSYGHERQLAGRSGQAAWSTYLIPFAVDGIVLAASIVLLWAVMEGIKGWGRLWRPRLWLAVGIAATISANFFSDLRFWWLGPAVSASCGVALVIISDIAFWLLGEQRKITAPGVAEDAAETEAASAGEPAFAQLPPPPLSLAGAVEAAEAYGMSRNKIAVQFDITRYRVGQILGPAADPAEAAAELADAAAMNGASA